MRMGKYIKETGQTANQKDKEIYFLKDNVYTVDIGKMGKSATKTNLT